MNIFFFLFIKCFCLFLLSSLLHLQLKHVLDKHSEILIKKHWNLASLVTKLASIFVWDGKTVLKIVLGLATVLLPDNATLQFLTET